MMKSVAALLSAVVVVAALAPASAGKYQIRIDNLARAQPLSPFVIATHAGGLDPIFEFNQPASDEIIEVAENGNGQPLFNSLRYKQGVTYVTMLDGPILPGQYWEGEIEINDNNDYLSMASMAINTNDCFVGLAGERIRFQPMSRPLRDRAVFYLNGLDAGSEENNEKCSSIPGPACPPGLNERSLNGEGFVHVHRGFFGVNANIPTSLIAPEDLSVRGTPLEADRYDWRNPMVKVTIYETF